MIKFIKQVMAARQAAQLRRVISNTTEELIANINVGTIPAITIIGNTALRLTEVMEREPERVRNWLDETASLFGPTIARGISELKELGEHLEYGSELRGVRENSHDAIETMHTNLRNAQYEAEHA